MILKLGKKKKDLNFRTHSRLFWLNVYHTWGLLTCSMIQGKYGKMGDCVNSTQAESNQENLGCISSCAHFHQGKQSDPCVVNMPHCIGEKKIQSHIKSLLFFPNFD